MTQETYEKELVDCPDCGGRIVHDVRFGSDGMGNGEIEVACEECDFHALETWVISHTSRIED